MEKTIITKILFNLGYFFLSRLVSRKDNKIDYNILNSIDDIYRDLKR